MPAETIARKLFELAKIPQMGDCGVGHLAEALLGRGALDFDEQSVIVHVVADPWRILIQHGLEDVELTVAVALGLAIWWQRTRPAESMHVSAESLALCIAVPPLALRDAVIRLQANVEEIADEFVVRPVVVTHRMRALHIAELQSGTRHRFALSS